MLKSHRFSLKSHLFLKSPYRTSSTKLGRCMTRISRTTRKKRTHAGSGQRKQYAEKKYTRDDAKFIARNVPLCRTRFVFRENDENVEISLIVWFGFDLTRRLGGILLSRYVRKFWRGHGTRDAYRQREVNVDARDVDSRRFARTLFVRDGLVRRRDIDSYARLCGACQRRGRRTRSTRTTRNYTSIV